MAEMKVKIPPVYSDAFYYPDVMVVCDPADKNRYYRERPTIIIEVLSPDTERTDRREKANADRQIPTLAAYIMVESSRIGWL